MILSLHFSSFVSTPIKSQRIRYTLTANPSACFHYLQSRSSVAVAAFALVKGRCSGRIARCDRSRVRLAGGSVGRLSVLAANPQHERLSLFFFVNAAVFTAIWFCHSHGLFSVLLVWGNVLDEAKWLDMKLSHALTYSGQDDVF